MPTDKIHQSALFTSDGKIIKSKFQPTLITVDGKSIENSPTTHYSPATKMPQKSLPPAPTSNPTTHYYNITTSIHHRVSSTTYPTTTLSTILSSIITYPAPTVLSLIHHHTCYVTHSTAESGIIDEIDNIDQEDEDILFWKQRELLKQEYDKVIEEEEDPSTMIVTYTIDVLHKAHKNT